MVKITLMALSFFVGFGSFAESATIKRITKTKKMIELVCDPDEILDLRLGATIVLKIEETEATAVVKKVLPGNKVHVDTTGGDLSLLEKGAVVTITAAEQAEETEAAEVNSSGTVVKVNKKKLQILTKVDVEWVIELGKLEAGAEIFVMFDGIKQPIPLYFEKISKTSVVFGFDSKNIAQMKKELKFTPVQKIEEQAGAAAGVMVLPWFTFSGSPGLWMQKANFIDAGYRYLDLTANLEVDGNKQEDTYKVNGGYAGGRFAFDVYRVGFEIEQVVVNNLYKIAVMNTSLNLGVHTSVIDFGVDLANISTAVTDDFFLGKSSYLQTVVNFGYSNNWFGVFVAYAPRALDKGKTSVEDQETGETEEKETKGYLSSSAEAGFWVRSTSKLMLKMQLSNYFNDGIDGDEKEEKFLANNRLGYNIGATSVGDLIQFSAGIARNQSGLVEGGLLYTRFTPMTGVYLGTAAVFNAFAVGMNFQWQRGAIAQKNDEYEVDVVNKNTSKIFSINVGLKL